MSNRVAFVTGSSRGIGRATALALQQAGYDIVVASFEVEKNEEVAAEIRAAGGNAMTSNLNLTSLDSVRASFAEAYKQFGRIDVLVNNAGITKDGLAMRMKPEDWNLVLQINLTGAFLRRAAGAAADGEAALGADHQYRIGGGTGGQRGPGELCRRRRRASSG